MTNKNTITYRTPTVEILFHGEDVISTSAIELPFIPMSNYADDEEPEM